MVDNSPRCFVCANGNPVEPRMHYISERSLGDFLQATGLQLGMNARRCFTRHGGEIEDVALVMHNEVLFLSAGEDFLPCRQTDAEALSFTCQVLLEEELYHRRLVAENGASVSVSQLYAPAPLAAPAPRVAAPPSAAPYDDEWGATDDHEEEEDEEESLGALAATSSRFASALPRTASFGLSAVGDAVGDAGDRWGDPAVAWTPAQLVQQVPPGLLAEKPARRARPSSMRLQPEPEPEPQPEPEPPKLYLEPEPEPEVSVASRFQPQLSVTLPPPAQQPALSQPDGGTYDDDVDEDEAAAEAEQEAIYQLLLQRETKLMRIYAFYVEHQPPDMQTHQKKPGKARARGHISPRSSMSSTHGTSPRCVFLLHLNCCANLLTNLFVTNLL